MKIRCRECNKIFDEKDIIIDGVLYDTYFVPYCKDCHKKEFSEEYKK